ncbi:MAG: winged helix-turn-helix domain-containing protein, partial [Methanocorpusculum sp.]|nr:winged helix-turn-helix domain-containing protein [Methanocorpusculum sp.]
GQTEKLSKRSMDVLNLINENPKITRTEISQKLGINSSAVQKHISALKENGIIVRKGGDFGGYWKIIEK